MAPFRAVLLPGSVLPAELAYGALIGALGSDADPVAKDLEVYATAQRVIERARNGEGPSLVEAVTYRHGGHSRADPGSYRPDDEVAAWKARDPITTYRARLEADRVPAADLDAIDADVTAQVAAAEAEARVAPEPTTDALETQLWADGGSAWRN